VVKQTRQGNKALVQKKDIKKKKKKKKKDFPKEKRRQKENRRGKGEVVDTARTKSDRG